MKKLLAILLLLLGITEAEGQSTSCGFEQIRAGNPGWEAASDFYFDGLKQWRQSGQIPHEYPNPEVPFNCDHCLTINPSLSQAKFVIPIVIHVVHLPNDSVVGMGSNISLVQIQDQIKQLNSYYANISGGSKSVNTGIQFCLAPVGPDHNGIIRYSTLKSNHRIDSMKYLNFLALNKTLPQDRYLHIFTCNNILSDTGIRGYSSVLSDIYQGVVIEYNRFGKYDSNNPNINVQLGSQGKVLAHEVGHFLGLEHTSYGACGQDNSDCHTQGDRCCDTPPVFSFNFNCSSGRNSCHESYNGDLPDQTENYMDYAGENCQNTFTHDQTQIMHYFLLKLRTNLVDPVHINSLNLPCATFSAWFKPASNTICQKDTVSLTALRYADTVNAKYFWIVLRNNSVFKTDSGINKYSAKFRLDSIGYYKVILTVRKGYNSVSDTLTDAVLAQNCGTPKASTQGNWYFGQYAGLRFTSNDHIIISDKAFTAKPNKTIDSDEGCVTQSTADGRLLFYGGGKVKRNIYGQAYSDSFYVYDKTHQLMPHGIIVGTSSSTQGGVIVPYPGDGKKYYLITSYDIGTGVNDLLYNGLRWNIIDTSLNGGKGDVDSVKRNRPIRVPLGIEKVNIYDSAVRSGEGIAAIPHCDGIRHWLVTGSGNDFGSKKIHVFLTDTGGVFYHHSDSMPVIRYTSSSTTASRDGNFVSISGNLFSFDRISGRLTFLKNLDSLGLTANYSEFSPNSNVLYTVLLYTDTIFVPFLRQTDLRSSSFNSRIFPLKLSNRMPQLGPDGRIYLTQYNEGSLSVIEYPDLVNTQSNTNACGYNQDVISLNPNGTNMLAKIGLPNMVDANSTAELGNSFTYMATACLSYTFRPVIDCSDFYIWDFGDGDTAHGYSVSHSFNLKGSYSVTLITDSDTVTRTVQVGMHLSKPSIVGPLTICDTSFRKNYSAIFSNSQFLDSISALQWIAYHGEIAGLSNKTSTEIKWNDEGRVTLVYQDRYNCFDSVWVNVAFADSAIYNNTINKSDTIFCDSTEKVTITGTLPNGGAGNYEFYWFRSQSSFGPWFLVSGEYDDTLFNAYPGYYYYRKVVSDGCEDISNIISPSKGYITDNIITDSSQGCTTFKLKGSIPSSPNGSFRYKWFLVSSSGDMELDTLKDQIPVASRQDLLYYRQVKSGSCITNSNIIKVVNFEQNNYIAKYIPIDNSCSPEIRGSELDLKFPNVRYQWQTSTDNISWSDVTGDTGRNFAHSITDSIARYYRRKAIDTGCESYSNVIENRAVKFLIPPYQYNTCADSLFPMRLKYQFDKPYYIGPINIIWQLRKTSGTVWKSIDYTGYDDTLSQLNETVNIIGGGTETLTEGDTLRMLCSFYCGTYFSFYSLRIIIRSEATLSILSQPRDTVINAGNKAVFRVVVNYPAICNFLWQYSKTGTGSWVDIIGSNRDTFKTGLTGGCNDSLYYRVKITHPCGVVYSNAAKLKINNNNPAFDYWLKDQWTDTGREINLDSIEVVKSPDIWVRYFKDGVKHHQLPTNTLDSNWVYATIRNRGSQPIKSAKVFLYWSWGSTGEWWDENWTENPANMIISPNGLGIFPMGGEINKKGYDIDSIAPGDSIRIAVPWRKVPQLDWYDLTKTFWRDRINICLLARIQTCQTDPFGITFKEVVNVRRNAYKNNNIAIKNTFVVHLFPPPINPWQTGNDHGGDGEHLTTRDNIVNGGTIRVRNQSDAADVIKICVNLKQSTYLTKANAFIELDPELYAAWVAGGSVSSGLLHIVGRTYKLTSTNACLSNISVAAGFEDNVRLLYGYRDIKDRFSDNVIFDFALRQYDGDDAVVGECLFQVRDNAFTSPTVLTFTENLNACNFDGSGGYLKYTVPCPDLSYTIWDANEEEYIPNNSNDQYYLLPGEYLITCFDDLNYQIKKTTLTVGSSDPNPVNNIDTVWYDCVYPDSVDYIKSCENGVMYDRFDQEVSESSSGHYTLDPQEPYYTFVCADSANCIKYSTQIHFMDIIQVPSSTSNYLTGMYNRSENPCCFIDLTEAECDGETPLSFGQEIQVYDMDAEFLYQTNLELYDGTILGFRFCPPQWDTSSNVISNWYSIVIRNDECSFCRMDFMCDSVGDPEPFVILNYPSGKLTGGVSQTSGKANTNGAVQTGENKPTAGKLPISVSVYPNPATSEVSVKVLSANSSNLTVQISDATGKPVYSTNYETSSGNLAIKVNLADFVSGVYTVYIPELNYYYKLVIIK